MNAVVEAFLKDLTNDNLKEKVGELLDSIKGNYVDNNQCQLMFILHNRIYPDNKEYTQSCPPCRERVWKRLKDYKNN